RLPGYVEQRVEALDVGEGHGVQGGFRSETQARQGHGGRLLQVRFELREHAFDRVQVRRVSGQVPELYAPLGGELLDTVALVHHVVVQHQHLPGRAAGQQAVAQVGLEHWAVEAAVHQ